MVWQTADGPRDFPVTDWGNILHLADSSDPAYSRALEALAERYWSPVLHYVRVVRRAPIEDAKDLTQQFFTMLLTRGDLRRLCPDRGSFRGFLKTSIRNFVASDARARKVRSPRGDARLVPIDAAGPEPSTDATPEVAFDREWARIVLMEAVECLRRTLEVEGKRVYFEVFRDYCLDPDPATSGQVLIDPGKAPTYRDLAERHGLKETDIGNYLRACRKRLKDILRRQVADYIGDGDIEAELSYLLAG